MLALVRYDSTDLRLEHVSRPRPGADEVLVRVAAAAIGEADWAERCMDTRARPFIIGREFSGLVDELGAAVRGWQTGARVTAIPFVAVEARPSSPPGEHAPSDECGRLAAAWNGACAEYVCVPAASLVSVPPEAALVDAALAAPAADALHAVRQGGVSPGDRVVVLGAGTLGILAAQWARIWGAGQVLVIDDDEARLALARRMWLGDVGDARHVDAVRWVEERSGGEGVSLVLETSGAPAAVEQALGMAGRSGRVVLAGRPDGAATLSAKTLMRLQEDELTLRGARSAHTSPETREEWRVALGMIAGRRLDVRSLITHRLPLSRAMEAAALFHRQDAASTRVMLQVADDDGRMA
jgi:L-iditol 2-dehydrogenase